jgi:hypothetical protein
VLSMLDKPIELRRIETLLDEVMARRSGTGTNAARRQTSTSDQPFFGTARVARPSSTRIERRDPDTELQKPATGALERRRSEIGFAGEALVPHTPQLPPLSMPVPSPLPFAGDNTPLPQALQQAAPPPIRTPLPFAAEPRDPALVPPKPMRTPLPLAMPPSFPPGHPAAGQPTGQPPPFRTPIPGVGHPGGMNKSAAMRTPLPFLTQPPVPPTDVVPPPPSPPAPIRTPLPEKPASLPASQLAQYPTTSFLRRSVDAPVKGTGYVRRPSGLFLAQPDQPVMPDQPTTSRIRRGVTGSHLPPSTARFTGGQPPVANGPSAPSRSVACAHCRRVFMVAKRDESYTVVCVHCGQLNRIDPL